MFIVIIICTVESQQVAIREKLKREREREFICQVSINIYNVHEITYNGRLPERHTPIYAGHL